VILIWRSSKKVSGYLSDVGNIEEMANYAIKY
jgi:hypothetical protein